MGTMELLCLLVAAVSIGMWLVYHYQLRLEPGNNFGTEKETASQMMSLFILLGIAFIVKSLLASVMEGHGTDVGCFTAWSDMVYENGITKFYHLDAFTDYPPGYMYILYFTAAFRKLFGIEAGSGIGVYLIKLVPIFCDLAAGYVIYKIARKRFSQGSSLFLCGCYVLNPLVVLDSSFWCQVDSVFTLTVLLMCYLFMEKKRILAYFVFAIGVLLKPQTLIFGPVLIFVIIDQVFIHEFSTKKFVKDLIGGLAAVVSLFLLALPFGLEKVITQYVETLGSYEYASVNAYNFWGFLGRNWAAQDGKFLFLEYRQWGTLAIVAAVALGAWVYFKHIKDDSKYYLSSVVIVCTMFMFSVRMHERYIYPAIVLMLVAYIVKPKKEFFYSYIALSAVSFVNVAHVLHTFVEYETTGPNDIIVRWVAVAMMIVYGYVMIYCFSSKKEDIFPFIRTRKGLEKPDLRPKKKPFAIASSQIVEKLTRVDYIVMFSIITVYSVIALVNLGSFSAPETPWNSQKDGTEILLDLGEQKTVNEVWAFLGNYESRNFQVEVGNDLNQPFQLLQDTNFASVFNWQKAAIKTSGDNGTDTVLAGRYIKLTAKEEPSVLMELVLLDQDGNQVTPVNASQYESLFDEADTFEDQESYLKGTIFDEVYHARTAYEMKEGLYCYENTHPPLGKFLISLGVRTFGMNPFGWRIVGTLFGIGMLPFIYLFGRRMFNKTWLAGVVTTLFAFDFMHYVQTRIATIDVYGTFFIIAMYYFMYRYSQMSFYDTKLKKTLVPLGLSGLCMGLGIASKWTAVYAGAGLAVIFFCIIGCRVREYLYASKRTAAKTSGISNAHVVSCFKKNMLITLGACVIFFILIPGIIYLLSYLPFSDGTNDGLWTQMIRNQQTMFSYHSALVAEHPYSSWWYEWPIILRPVFYYSNSTVEGLVQGISAFGNPLVWWVGIPASMYMVYRIFKYKDKLALFLIAAYMVQLGPWMLVTRITFMYHYFPSVPFIVLMIGYCMKCFAGENKRRIRGAIVYTAASVALFALFYPVLNGMPVESEFVVNGLKWMKDWVLTL